MWRRLNYLNEGAWTPGHTNWLVLAVQLLLTVQAASRGLDFVQPRPPGTITDTLSVVEAAAPLPLWGGGLLLAVTLVFGGLFGGWTTPIIVGHGLLAALYGAFSYGLIDQTPTKSGPEAVAGVVLLLAGVYLGVSRWDCWRWVRFAAAMLLVIVGGWIAAEGMGYDFRTGTSLLVAALNHTAFAIGVAFIAYRTPDVVR